MHNPRLESPSEEQHVATEEAKLQEPPAQPPQSTQVLQVTLFFPCNFLDDLAEWGGEMIRGKIHPEQSNEEVLSYVRERRRTFNLRRSCLRNPLGTCVVCGDKRTEPSEP